MHYVVPKGSCIKFHELSVFPDRKLLLPLWVLSLTAGSTLVVVRALRFHDRLRPDSIAS